MKVSRQTALLGCIAVCLLGVVLYKATSSRPLDWHVNRLANCIGRADSKCVMGYIPSQEVLQSGLTEESLNLLLRDAGLKRGSPVSVRSDVAGSWRLSTAMFARENGGSLEIEFVMSDTAEGIRAPMFLGTFLLSQMNPESKHGADRVRARVEYIQKNRTKFERNGITGFNIVFDKPAVSWDEFIAQNEARIARMEAAKLNPPPKPGS